MEKGEGGARVTLRSPTESWPDVGDAVGSALLDDGNEEGDQDGRRVLQACQREGVAGK